VTQWLHAIYRGLFARAEQELRDRLMDDPWTRFVEDTQRLTAFVTAELYARYNNPSSSGSSGGSKMSD
jgi:hypothetical protein